MADLLPGWVEVTSGFALPDVTFLRHVINYFPELKAELLAYLKEGD